MEIIIELFDNRGRFYIRVVNAVRHQPLGKAHQSMQRNASAPIRCDRKKYEMFYIDRSILPDSLSLWALINIEVEEPALAGIVI